jgi:hypothetical protein
MNKFLIKALFFLTVLGGGHPLQASEHRDRLPAATSTPCLKRVWQAGPATNRDFDVEYDELPGGARFSCDAATSASAVAGALRHLKEAIARGDKAAVIRNISFPLNFTDILGRKYRFSSPAALRPHYSRVFSARLRTTLKCSRIADFFIRPTEGLSLSNGGIWFVVEHTGDFPHLSAINERGLATNHRSPLGAEKCAVGSHPRS